MKPFWQSLTFWATVLWLVSSVLKKLGYYISEELQTQLAQFILDAINYFVGPIGVIWGRFRAENRLTWSKK